MNFLKRNTVLKRGVLSFVLVFNGAFASEPTTKKTEVESNVIDVFYELYFNKKDTQKFGYASYFVEPNIKHIRKTNVHELTQQINRLCQFIDGTTWERRGSIGDDTWIFSFDENAVELVTRGEGDSEIPEFITIGHVSYKEYFKFDGNRLVNKLPLNIHFSSLYGGWAIEFPTRYGATGYMLQSGEIYSEVHGSSSERRRSINTPYTYEGKINNCDIDKKKFKVTNIPW